ncbi:Pho80p cyclin [Coemansia sp. RSA 989]|nr:Pho80p cyclin [Coemansia sp. RSA 1086]KAJ1752725.1 Pho80p cyclin [Coemansia sp. RSA 1821]KAJ1868309.1 Pho80p cyclin [Coemansia sp. RSA 989]KAJ1875579.1 Pho80p cyclin [Coemansia sp. RSA 990]KAJ2633078.1 Pho80p cyclin [Coemansia sp. RSA 1290]KAJ2650466.1 Pho80p cyclin [Coemansia sp. RSA 1250]KAJ2673137.1 Pho80p cyclin [Coemansia sp. RSA 1085]
MVSRSHTMTSPVVVMPDSYFNADMEKLTQLVANMFTRVVAHNDRLPLGSQKPTRFHSRAPPNISVSEYMQRVAKYASLEPACLLIMLIYVDRICERNPTFTISSLTVHRFIITAAVIACKTLCDAYCTNAHYAKVGGVSMHELNSLEVEILRMMGWHLIATQEQLEQYYFTLVRQDAHMVLQSDIAASAQKSKAG